MYKSKNPLPVCCVRTLALLLTVVASSHSAQADVRATRSSLVSEFASFNTPGALDGRLEAIAVDSDTVFVGGTFGMLNDERNRRGLVKIDDFGDRMSGFSARPDALVASMVRLNNTLYMGGNFSTISGVDVENLAALDTVSGFVDVNLSLDFDGAISTEEDDEIEVRGVQGVEVIDITSDGELLVVVDNFSSINGI